MIDCFSNPGFWCWQLQSSLWVHRTRPGDKGKPLTVSIFVKYFSNIFQIFVEYLSNICWIFVKYLLNICQIFFEYLLNIWIFNIKLDQATIQLTNISIISLCTFELDTKQQGKTCNCLNLSLEYFRIQHLNMLTIDEKGFKIKLLSLTVLLNGVWQSRLR